MNKILRRFVIISLIFSPLWVGAFATMDEAPDSVASIAVFIALIIGAPIIAVCGSVATQLLKEKQHGAWLSVVGYLIPAAVVCAYMLFEML